MNPLAKVLFVSNSHIGNIIGTAAVGGSVFLVCWHLSNKGLLDIAATGLSFFIVSLLRFIAPNLRSSVPIEFRDSAGMIDTLRADCQRWIANRRMWAYTLLAALLTIVFLVMRYVASLALGVIASPLIAFALGLLVVAFMSAPMLFKAAIDTVRQRRQNSDNPSEIA